MPTYEYACTACGHRLDAVQKFSDDPLTVCPECGGALRKVYGAVGIVLKGSGFYKNDSRTGSNGSSSKKDGDSKESTSSESSTSSDSTSSSSSDSAAGPKTDGAKSDGAKSGSEAKSSPTKESKPAATTAT